MAGWRSCPRCPSRQALGTASYRGTTILPYGNEIVYTDVRGRERAPVAAKPVEAMPTMTADQIFSLAAEIGSAPLSRHLPVLGTAQVTSPTEGGRCASTILAWCVALWHVSGYRLA